MKKDKLDIIYEDKSIIVINKPAHLLTVSTDNEKEKTLFHQVMLYEKRKNKNNKVFIVHRLDYETSGLVIFAKNIEIKKFFQDNWKSVTRKYLAIVNGQVQKEKGVIKSYLKETKTNLVYINKKSKDGLLAITNYRKILVTNKYSLLEILIKTGRKNQIRVQLSDIGHPLLGDSKYGIKTKQKRMFLHAYYLKFNHPITMESLEFELDVPNDFLKILKCKI